MGMDNLRQFLSVLRHEKELVTVDSLVDPCLEIAEIHRRIVDAEGPALFFRNVKGSRFPVVTNLFGTTKRLRLAFPNKPEVLIQKLITLATEDFPPSLKALWQHRQQLTKLRHLRIKKTRSAPVMQSTMPHPNLNALPLLKLWPDDGGHFITLPLVYTERPDGSVPNLGMYRLQRYDHASTGLHYQIGKGGGFHYYQAEQQDLPLPITIFLGGPPALIISAITPLPENISELLFAALLSGQALKVTHDPQHPHPIIGECEFALLGQALPQERRIEGPFGDHYGYYSKSHPFPVFHCSKIYHRTDAIYPATVVGKPRQEDYFIGNYLQELLSPLFPVMMPTVKALWSYGETGFHSLAAAIVHERYWRESMMSAFRILGEGQLSLTKFLLITDQPVDLRNFRQVLTTVLERFKPETDLFIFSHLAMDTLDYAGPKLNEGSRGVMLGLGDKLRDLPHDFEGSIPNPLTDVIPFCPGCLLLEGPGFEVFQDFPQLLCHADFARWPLLILVDNITKAYKDVASFLWTTFTRFEPAADIHANHCDIHRHHLCYSGPILIDARMKSHYPSEVTCDEETTALVNQRWNEYFS